MSGPLTRFLMVVAGLMPLALSGNALAQTWTISDITTSKATSCTGYSVGVNNTLTFVPNGCLGLSTSSGTDPLFSLRVVPTSTVQPSAGVVGLQAAEVYVDADKDVPSTTTYNLSLNLCTSAQGCTSASSGNWYFLRYAELGAASVAPQDQVTTGSFPFAFQPGANTGGAPNLRSMGIGRIEIPNTPLFSGTRNVMLGLAGAQVAPNVVTHTIAGGQGGDTDINGNPIPDPTGTASGCEFPGSTPSPGAGSGPCGSYPVQVPPTATSVSCSNEMNPGSEITNAWQYNMAYAFGTANSLRFGMQPRHAISFRIKTPTIEEAAAAAKPTFFPHLGSVTTIDNQQRGSNGGIYVSVSEKRCDFRRSTFQTGTLDLCHRTSNTLITTISYTLHGNNTDPDAPFKCNLRPGKQYYVNIRFENVQQAPGTTACSLTDGKTTCGVEFQVN